MMSSLSLARDPRPAVSLETPAESLAWSPDGSQLAYQSRGAWLLRPDEAPRRPFGSAELAGLSWDGAELFAISTEGVLSWYSGPRHYREARMIVPGRVERAYPQTGGDLVALLSGRSLRVVDRAGRPIAYHRGAPGGFRSFGWHPRANELSFANRMGLFSWKPERSQSMRRLLALPVEQLSYSPSGRHLLALDHEGKAHLWTLSRPGHTHPPQLGPVLAHAWEEEGRWLAISLADGAIWLWDCAGESGVSLSGSRLLQGCAAPARSLSFGGGLLAAGDEAGRVTLWRVGEREPCAQGSCGEPVRALALSRDGARLAAAGARGGLFVHSTQP